MMSLASDHRDMTLDSSHVLVHEHTTNLITNPRMPLRDAAQGLRFGRINKISRLFHLRNEVGDERIHVGKLFHKTRINCLNYLLEFNAQDIHGRYL